MNSRKSPFEPISVTPDYKRNSKKDLVKAHLFEPHFRFEENVQEDDSSLTFGAPRVFLRQPLGLMHPLIVPFKEPLNGFFGRKYSVEFKLMEGSYLSRGSTLYFLYSFDESNWFEVIVKGAAKNASKTVQGAYLSEEDYLLDRDLELENFTETNGKRSYGGVKRINFSVPEEITFASDLEQNSFPMHVGFVLEVEKTLVGIDDRNSVSIDSTSFSVQRKLGPIPASISRGTTGGAAPMTN